MTTVAALPCPTCKGSGDMCCETPCQRGGHTDCAGGRPMDVACPACNGSGVERMVPEAALRAWIEDKAPYRVGSWRYSAALDDLSSFLDGLDATGGER